MRRLILAAVLAVTGCGACQPDKPTPAAASASASIGPPNPPPPTLASHHPPPPKLACRVAALDGDARIESPALDAGAPLLLQGLAPTEAWITLGKDTRVVARDPRTTRETTFRGPGRVRTCVGFAEESWLAAGTFESSIGAGESAGNEEWVVTPSGVVRYTAAKVSLVVAKHETDATLESGVAFAWQVDAGDAGLEEGWRRLPPGKTKLLEPHEEPSATVARCTAMAASARSLASQVMAPGGGAEAGVITAQVTARRIARAACAVAALRVNALPAAEAAPLLRPLADANTAWSGVPGAP
jgi:hypothetical protein